MGSTRVLVFALAGSAIVNGTATAQPGPPQPAQPGPPHPAQPGPPPAESMQPAPYPQPAPDPQPAPYPQPAAAPPAPKRWLAHITMHHGIGMISDTIDDDGASSPGVAFGLQAGAQYRITPTLSLGAGVDLTYSKHNSDYSAGAEAIYLNYFPTLVGRMELGRFAASGWAGLHFGSRSVTEPGGVLGGDREVSSHDLKGPVAGGAFVVRFALPRQKLTLEFGPFAQLAYLAAEDGGVRSLVIGLCSQVVFQGPPIAGDSF